jgi:hypothetical protein
VQLNIYVDLDLLVNAPPYKAGSFELRLKTRSAGYSAYEKHKIGIPLLNSRMYSYQHSLSLCDGSISLLKPGGYSSPAGGFNYHCRTEKKQYVNVLCCGIFTVHNLPGSSKLRPNPVLHHVLI